MTAAETDVLVVGAGPTGLTLAAQLLSFGARFRVVDRRPDRVHESRALAVLPRSLEVLAGLGIADTIGEARPSRTVARAFDAAPAQATESPTPS